MLVFNMKLLSVILSSIFSYSSCLELMRLSPKSSNESCHVNELDYETCYEGIFDVRNELTKLKGKTLTGGKLNITTVVSLVKDRTNNNENLRSIWKSHLNVKTRLTAKNVTYRDGSFSEIYEEITMAVTAKSIHIEENHCIIELYIDISKQIQELLKDPDRSVWTIKPSLTMMPKGKEEKDEIEDMKRNLTVWINELLLKYEDANCNFDEGCNWNLNTTAITVADNGSNCSGTTCKYGYIGHLTTETDMVSPAIIGSSRMCTLSFKILKIQQSVVVTISTANTTKILYDGTDAGDGKEKQWSEYNIKIGRIPGLFQISIHICKRSFIHTAVDDVILENCPEEIDKNESCSASEFLCSTGHCISKDMVCDGSQDCLFGEDEDQELCNSSQSRMTCDFDNDMCGWDTENRYGTQCVFKRTDLVTTKTSDCARRALRSPVAEDYGLFLNGTACMSNETAVLVSRVIQTSSNQIDCKIRFSYFLEDRGFLRLEKCDKYQNCQTVWENNYVFHRGPRWFGIVQKIKPYKDRYILQFRAHTFMKRDIALDGITFSPGCFQEESQGFLHYVQSSNNSSFSAVWSSSHKESQGTSFTLIGAGVGTVIGLVAAAMVFAGYSRHKNILLKDIWRKSFGHSLKDHAFARVADEPTNFKVVTPFNSDGASGNRFQPDGLAVSTTSPYYEWFEQTDNIIRNIPRKKIRLLKLLGKGAFGEVYQGMLADVAHIKGEMPVAVKTLPSLCSEQTKSEFFFEAMTLSKFKHPNIVRFLGISVEDRSMYLILELIEGGDLRSCLRHSRPYQNRASNLSIKDLVRLCSDVAKGCQYLEANKYIHRDIAARNCLLDSRGPNRTAKIGDFGMARDVIRTNYYRKNGVAMVPVKWMPPESFLDGIFTSKTDVWAFGVTVWEVFSLGHTPYPGKSNADVMKFVEAGGRLDKPNICPDSIFTLMERCWRRESEERPSFTDVVESLITIDAELNKSRDYASRINVSDYLGMESIDENENSPMLEQQTDLQI